MITPGDKILGLSLAHGGHLTHGMKLNASAIFYKPDFYELDAKTETIDFNSVRAKAKELRPNVVLTDLAVPGMDGFEFCRALQQSDVTRDIPVLAVTGHSEYLDQPDRFRQTGILHVLTKPCAPNVIESELRRLLRESPGNGAA